VDIFAYCSDSAVFEYGRGGDIDSALWQYDEEEEKYLVRDIPSIEKIDIGVCVCVCVLLLFAFLFSYFCIVVLSVRLLTSVKFHLTTQLLAYQVARAIADMQDVEDDGYAPIAHSEYLRASLHFSRRCRFLICESQPHLFFSSQPILHRRNSYSSMVGGS